MTLEPKRNPSNGQFARTHFGIGGDEFAAEYAPPARREPQPELSDEEVIEACSSFEAAADSYCANGAVHWTLLNDLKKESGFSDEVVSEAVKRSVHREVLADYGDPRATPSFERAVSMARETRNDEDSHLAYLGACKKVGRELAGRPWPGEIFDTAVRESVEDAARVQRSSNAA
jgi:hypothetical protein